MAAGAAIGAIAGVVSGIAGPVLGFFGQRDAARQERKTAQDQAANILEQQRLYYANEEAERNLQRDMARFDLIDELNEPAVNLSLLFVLMALGAVVYWRYG